MKRRTRVRGALSLQALTACSSVLVPRISVDTAHSWQYYKVRHNTRTHSQKRAEAAGRNSRRQETAAKEWAADGAHARPTQQQAAARRCSDKGGCSSKRHEACAAHAQQHAASALCVRDTLLQLHARAATGAPRVQSDAHLCPASAFCVCSAVFCPCCVAVFAPLLCFFLRFSSSVLACV